MKKARGMRLPGLQSRAHFCPTAPQPDPEKTVLGKRDRPSESQHLAPKCPRSPVRSQAEDRVWGSGIGTQVPGG